MTLRLAPGPEDGLPIVARALHDKSGRRRGADQVARGETAPPVPIFVLEADALDDVEPLAHAYPVGWRYVARRGGVTVDVELSYDEEGALELYGTRTGRGAALLLAVARRAERDYDACGDFEVRLLRIPALYLEALWLTSPEKQLFLSLERASRSWPMLEEGQARRQLMQRAMESYDEISTAQSG